MGILDEAIKEHLELKRQHGAGEPELKKLEDEAFGPSERPGSEEAAPDQFAEAPTEFMAQPETADVPVSGQVETGQTAEEESGAPVDEREEAVEKTRPRREPAMEIGDLQEAPQSQAEQPSGEEASPEPEAHPGDETEELAHVAPPGDAPAEEEAPAMEHEAITEPPVEAQEPHGDEPEPLASSPGPSTEERRAIADQPTEMYDVEEELGAAKSAPSEEELVEEELSEPKLASGPPLSEVAHPGEVEEPAEPTGVDGETEEHEISHEEDDEFWDEKRLSDELDQALEAPSESDEDDWSSEEEQPVDEPPMRSGREEDLLEETPDFLEESPEDDQLWFEQKPPKDFDFDD
ncbi:MAG: hypothetical protein WBM00_05390 [Solirubrobacterales bacterium]